MDVEACDVRDGYCCPGSIPRCCCERYHLCSSVFGGPHHAVSLKGRGASRGRRCEMLYRRCVHGHEYRHPHQSSKAIAVDDECRLSEPTLWRCCRDLRCCDCSSRREMAQRVETHEQQVTFTGNTRHVYLTGQPWSPNLTFRMLAHSRDSFPYPFRSRPAHHVPPAVTSQWQRRYMQSPPAAEALVGRIPLKAS
jgi:hypothetical protein